MEVMSDSTGIRTGHFLAPPCPCLLGERYSPKEGLNAYPGLRSEISSRICHQFDSKTRSDGFGLGSLDGCSVGSNRCTSVVFGRGHSTVVHNPADGAQRTRCRERSTATARANREIGTRPTRGVFDSHTNIVDGDCACRRIVEAASVGCSDRQDA